MPGRGKSGEVGRLFTIKFRRRASTAAAWKESFAPLAIEARATQYAMYRCSLRQSAWWVSSGSTCHSTCGKGGAVVSTCMQSAWWVSSGSRCDRDAIEMRLHRVSGHGEARERGALLVQGADGISSTSEDEDGGLCVITAGRGRVIGTQHRAQADQGSQR